jgi:hypothetical protein
MLEPRPKVPPLRVMLFGGMKGVAVPPGCMMNVPALLTVMLEVLRSLPVTSVPASTMVGPEYVWVKLRVRVPPVVLRSPTMPAPSWRKPW